MDHYLFHLFGMQFVFVEMFLVKMCERISSKKKKKKKWTGYLMLSHLFRRLSFRYGARDKNRKVIIECYSSNYKAYSLCIVLPYNVEGRSGFAYVIHYSLQLSNLNLRIGLSWIKCFNMAAQKWPLISQIRILLSMLI
jgi:hypothetical protein